MTSNDVPTGRLPEPDPPPRSRPDRALPQLGDRLDQLLEPVLRLVETQRRRMLRLAGIGLLGTVALTIGLAGGWIVAGGVRTAVALVVATVALLPVGALAYCHGRLGTASDDVRALVLAFRGFADDESRAQRVLAVLAPIRELDTAGTLRGRVRVVIEVFRNIRDSLDDVRGLAGIAERLTRTFGVFGGIALAIGVGGTVAVTTAGTVALAFRVVLLVI